MTQIIQTVGKLLGVDLYVKLTPRQLSRYEAETLKALGRGETHYAWSHQFRPEKAEQEQHG